MIERVQSGWCVPCGGMFSLNAAGDDPAAGVDTACDGDSQGLKDAVNACLSAVPSGEACCSTDANCADPSSARCGSAGCVDMPEWDVSLVTDMSELFKAKAHSTWISRRGIPRRSRTCGTCFFAPAPSTKTSDRGIPRRSPAWGPCSIAPARVQPRHRLVEYRAGHEHGEFMFWRADAFNQAIGSWNTAQVTDMSDMFRAAAAFNQDIGSWNTAQVTSMGAMFDGRRRVQPSYRIVEYRAGHEHG